MFVDHPALQSSHSKRSWGVITFLRALFFCIALALIDGAVDLGTSTTMLALGAACGVALGSRCAFSTLTGRGLLIFCGLGVAAFYAISHLLYLVPFSQPASIFFFYLLNQHTALFLLIGGAGLLTTWWFWRSESAATIESLALSSGVLLLLAGHRHYHFERPRIINSVAWNLGINEVSVFIGVGISLVLLTFIYFFLSSSPSRPHPTKPQYMVSRARPGITALLIFGAFFSTIVFIIARQTHWIYSEISLSRTANGVGQSKEEGLSPLGFHSALGGTNQPAALVRLEGDYGENPYSPMLYMRESALSEFNGRELVLASSLYDTDVPRTTPAQPYAADPDPVLPNRIEEDYSVYLLAEHKTTFTIDYPTKITPLKNPKPNRFKGAYRGASLAPTFGFNVSKLAGLKIGDSLWNQTTREHYLKTHDNPRYAILAEEITAGLSDPVEKTFAIVDYLSQKSTYTLTPNHTVAPGADPVEPYLFGDLRGYCVHFAHATVYMLRALGIPARIGTGYLTDLSQAKDGHILLRMSDRHAWAEVYVEGLGWAPFDTKPANVESHADTQVDMKLLEDLMSMLEPDEEILPKETAKDEPGLRDESEWTLPDPAVIGAIAAVLLALIVLLKLYIWHGWRLPGSPAARLRRIYRASLARIYDLGYRRMEGETRTEFMRRISGELRGPVLSATNDLLSLTYRDPQSPSDVKNPEVFLVTDKQTMKGIPIWRRILAALSLSSLLYSRRSSQW